MLNTSSAAQTEETGVRVVEVFRALDRGGLRQVGLSAEQVLRLCPESAGPGWSVVVAAEPVAEAAGAVHTWPSGRDRVHWDCPLCGRLHISDFEPHTDGNPVLWFCEAGDGRLCLVRWRRAEAEPGSVLSSGDS
jgi:hypothetical protein